MSTLVSVHVRQLWHTRHTYPHTHKQVLLGEGSCDAWYRRSVRTSMGHIFKTPVVRVLQMDAALHALNELDIKSYAAVCVYVCACICACACAT
jgi:hypothetical protein